MKFFVGTLKWAALAAFIGGLFLTTDHMIALGQVLKLGGLFALTEVALWQLGRLDKRLGMSFKDAHAQFVSGPSGGNYYGLRYGATILAIAHVLGVFLLVAIVSLPAPALAGAKVWTSQYDVLFKQARDLYAPGVPWCLLKAQAIAESGLDPNARSPAGALGLVQLMEGTARDVFPAIGFPAATRTEVEPSIRAQAYYMTFVGRYFADVPELERHRFKAAGYNAGAGNILKARRSCDHTDLWADAAECLPSITGRNARETIIYVPRIWSVWGLLGLC